MINVTALYFICQQSVKYVHVFGNMETEKKTTCKENDKERLHQ